MVLQGQYQMVSARYVLHANELILPLRELVQIMMWEATKPEVVDPSVADPARR